MQSIDTSSVHGTYDEADVSQPSIQTDPESSTAPTVYHALSNPSAEAPEEPGEGELLHFVGGGDIASDDPGTPRSQASPLSRMPSLNGSLNFDNGSIHSDVSELVFGDSGLVFASHTPGPEAKTSGPEPKTGDPKQDVPNLTDAQLHDAIDEHYGTPTWNSDFRPHLTADQHKVVQGHIQNIDEELGISKKSKLTANDLQEAINRHYGTPKWNSDVRPLLTADQHKTVQTQIQNIDEELGITEKRTRSKVDKPTRLGIGGQPFSNRPNKLIKKKPDYTEYHKLQGTPMPELSDKARALKILAAKKKAEGALMPKASAYTAYHTNPKRLIQSAGNVVRSAKNVAKSIAGKKNDEPQNT
jgi:hypothetical protein